MNIMTRILLLASLACCPWGVSGGVAYCSEINSDETTRGAADKIQPITKPLIDTDAARIKEHEHQLLKDLNIKIREQADNGDNYFRRAFILYQLKQYKDAFIDCDRAITLGFNHARVHLLKGEILFAQKQYSAALVETNKSISLSSKHSYSKAFALLAEIHNNLENYPEALRSISKAIELKPQEARYYVIRADLDYKVEQYSRCIEDASQALTLNQKSKMAYSIRSKAYLALNDLEHAKNDIATAKELPKDMIETH